MFAYYAHTYLLIYLMLQIYRMPLVILSRYFNNIHRQEQEFSIIVWVGGVGQF